MLCELHIDGQRFAFEVNGDAAWGQDEVLYHKGTSLIEGQPWEGEGYTKVTVFSEEEMTAFQEEVLNILKKILLEEEIPFSPDFSLEKYHETITTDALHQRVIARTRFLTYKDFHTDFKEIAERIVPHVNGSLSLQNPHLQEEIIILRISRPNSLDINPLHRDGYLGIWENVLNVWLPIAGCSQAASLPMLPGSHLWNETEIYRTANKGATINGRAYHVPAILATKKGLALVRPTPLEREALIFTPFLIHGAAINQNIDRTRISLEIRFFAV